MNTKLWHFHITLLKYVGLWPTNRNHLLFTIIFWLHFTATVILLILFEGICLLTFLDTNFMEFVKTFGTIAYHTLSLLTVLLWLFNLPIAVEICELIQRDSFKQFCCCVANVGFVTKSFDRARFWSLFVFYVFVVSAFCSIITSYVGICLFPEKIYNHESGTLLWVKPYNSYTFLNLEKIENFMVDISFQFYTISYMTLGFLFIDTFCLSAIIHMTEQLRIIADGLKRVQIDQKTTQRSKELINKCIAESAKVVEINNLLENLMSVSYLIRYTFVTLSICCIVYITPLERQKMKLIGYALFACILCAEPLIVSVLSQNLQEEFVELAKSVYLVNWLDADVPLRRTLVFFMRRMQKPVCITFGKFFPINTQLFIGIMKISYSFYTLISRNG